MLRQLPNFLTLSRILVIPVFVAAFMLPGAWGNWVSFALFSAAGLTDYFDGYLARRSRVTSALGRFLDPVADKLLVATAVLLLVSECCAPLLPALVILCRELLVSGLREFLAGLRVSVPVSRLAKWKTAIQMVALGVLLVGDAGAALVPAAVDLTLVGGVLLWVAAALTLVTGYGYLWVGLRHMIAPPAAAKGAPRSFGSDAVG